MTDGHGFEFTPFGILPLGSGQQAAAMLDLERSTGNATQAEADAFERRLGAAVRRATIDVDGVPVPERASAAPALPQAAHAPAPAEREPLSPRDLVREAKARIRAIDTELRRLSALQRERDELQRLVLAAKKKPAAVVPLTGRRTG